MGHGFQADPSAELEVVGQMRGQPTVVEAEELLEHQAGYKLVLGELLGAVFVAVRRQGLADSLVGDVQDPARRFARGHISYYDAMCTKFHRFSTEQLVMPPCGTQRS